MSDLTDRLRAVEGVSVATRVEAAERIAALEADLASARAESERLREALAQYADPTGYTDAQGEPYPADAELHPGLAALDALATSVKEA